MSLEKIAINSHNSFEDKIFYEIYLKLNKDFNQSKLVKRENIITFPIVFSWFSQNYRFDKETVKALLKELEKRKLVKRIPYHGLILEWSK